MKKHQKILNLATILIIMFSIFSFGDVKSFAFDSPNPSSQTTVGQKLPDSGTEKISTIPQKNAYALTHMKETGFKYGLFKFLMTMLGVLVSALAIFLGLKIYKKFILKNDAKFNNIDYNKTLESPKDFKEAINLFLNKTKK